MTEVWFICIVCCNVATKFVLFCISWLWSRNSQGTRSIATVQRNYVSFCRLAVPRLSSCLLVNSTLCYTYKWGHTHMTSPLQGEGGFTKWWRLVTEGGARGVGRKSDAWWRGVGGMKINIKDHYFCLFVQQENTVVLRTNRTPRFHNLRFGLYSPNHLG